MPRFVPVPTVPSQNVTVPPGAVPGGTAIVAVRESTTPVATLLNVSLSVTFGVSLLTVPDCTEDVLGE